jgi:malonyl-CoA O-methyltransferase
MTEPTFSLPKKSDVRRSFSRAASTYDDAAFLQREVCDRLFERLQYIKLNPVNALDMGAGTGYSTEKLRAAYPQGHTIALDCAHGMLEFARHKLLPPVPPQSFAGRLLTKLKPAAAALPRTSFVCGDAENLPLAAESVDLIVSSLTIQWCDPLAVAREAYRVLKPNGCFMFTTFGPDTLKELRTAFKAVDDKPHVNQFLDMHDVGDQLLSAGFTDPVMDQEIITLTYTALKPLLKELKAIGAHNMMPGRAQGLLSKTAWGTLQTAYEAFRRDDIGNRLPATYEVVYGQAWKPEIAKQKTVDGVQAISLPDFKRMLKIDG